MPELTIVPISSEEVKKAIEAYGRQASEALRRLYEKYNEFNAKYWTGELPAATLAIAVEMHDKKLAHYASVNGLQLPHAIEFNRNFIALNWGGEVVELPDRTIIDHALLHEMIHLYLEGVRGEKYKDQQAAHGRSFRKEAERLGLKGKGRLMACAYQVKMPISAPKARKLRREQEAHDQDEDSESEDSEQSGNTKTTNRRQPALGPKELLKQLQQHAATELDSDQLTQFKKHLKAAAAILNGATRSDSTTSSTRTKPG